MIKGATTQTSNLSFNYERRSLQSFQIMIKEEDRLAAVVADIDEQVAIVPRGAFVKTPHGAVLQNRSFEGKLLQQFLGTVFVLVL